MVMVNYLDQIVLFGDSLTQMSWNPELGGIGARLTGTSILIMTSRYTSNCTTPQICMRANLTF
jgi:hypothetical protein